MSAGVSSSRLAPPVVASISAGAPTRRGSFAAARRAAREHLPDLLVLLSLCGLVPIATWQARTVGARLNDVNQTIEPSTRAVADLQLALSKEAAGTRAFLLTGNPAYAEEFHAARADRRQALGELAALSDSSVPGFTDVLSAATTELAVADGWLDGLYSGRITPAAYLAEFPNQHRRFTRVVSSASTLHARLRARAAAHRAEIDRTQRIAVALELGAVALALLAGASVVRLRSREREARLASDRAQADAEFRRAQLQTMTTRWTRLIRGFSHDLKNPLAAAQGHLFMLEKGVKGPLAPSQLHAVSKSRHSVDTAVALAADLVDLARAETAEVDVRRVDMNLCDLVASVVDDYRAQASAKGLSIDLAVPAMPEKLHSDPARVTQILGNLVSNAVKYTNAGTISIRVAPRPDAGGRDCLAVDVSDTGPGIPKEDQRRVFDEFERLDAASSPGMGIGLAISERLARTLGGALTLDSEPGKGSTFTLWLPA